MKQSIQKLITLAVYMAAMMASVTRVQAQGSASQSQDSIARRAEGFNARGRVAVLPINYIADAGDAKLQHMPYLLQEITIEYMNREAAELRFVEPVNVNAALLKAGIDESNIRRYTMEELARLLRVEYIIIGSVSQDKGNIFTHGHITGRERQTAERKRNGVAIKGRYHEHSSSVSGQHTENIVSLSIYNSDGTMIYSKTRHSLISTTDGYKYTIHYLLKRTPLFKR